MPVASSLNHLVRSLQERRRDCQVEDLGGLQVDQVSCDRGRLTRHLLRPVCHTHLATHRHRSREVFLRFPSPCGAPGELAEAEVAAGRRAGASRVRRPRPGICRGSPRGGRTLLVLTGSSSRNTSSAPQVQAIRTTAASTWRRGPRTGDAPAGWRRGRRAAQASQGGLPASVGAAGALGVLTVLQCPAMPTRAQRAGLVLADVPRSSLAKLSRQHWLDATIRTVLKRVLRRRRPKS